MDMNPFFYQHTVTHPPSRELSRDVDKVTRAVAAQNSDISRIEQRLDRLSLACQAMWELLRDSTNFEEQDIFTKMEEVDLRDGVADGKMSDPIIHCPNCGRKGSSRRRLCLYCGEPQASSENSAFK